MYKNIGEFEIQEDIYAYFRWNEKTKEIEILNPHEQNYKTIKNLHANSEKEAGEEVEKWRFNRSHKSK